ncbi:hypothetical protein BT96DRAFT_1026736 [Gymnopus androsaceus JB14]|uniref:Uncharacterized protein n=1 Tax=Gymnopus androsaceus JB14 TaxID=1447944 RepID=A0A6A4GHI5_9AGAR|nr:hypothetical protein BT96DRAFT_1026736 [Gymnopus androsaceus JB14]
MPLPRPAMPPPSFSNDVKTTVFLPKEIAVDIIRLQGEELIRVRRELEKSQDLYRTAFELIRATDQHVSEMQNAFRGRHTQISSLEAVIVNLQRENDSSLLSLENIRESMRKFCGSSFVDFETRSPNSSESTLPQDHFVDNQSDFKGSNNLDSLQNEPEVVEGQEDIVSIDDELTKANQNISDVLESSEAQAHNSPHSTNASVSPEEPASQFSRHNDSNEVEILRHELVDAVSHTNDLQYRLDAALEANEALEEKVMELSSQAQGASVDHSEIHSVKEEHANNSNDAGDKHDSSLLADEPSTSLKDVVVGQPDLIPSTVPVPQAILGTGTDVVDSSKSAVVDQPNSPVVNVRSGSLPPPASHVKSGNTPSNPTANSLQRKFVPAMTLCLPINLGTAKLTQVDNICSKVTGYSPTILQGYLKGKLIIDLHNQNGATLLAVSLDANKLCKLLTKELNEHWKDTFIAMDQGSAKMQLHVLGEYAYRGSSPSRLALSDYELLPEAAKDFILDSAKGLRHKEIKTKEQLVASLVNPGGIVIHGVTLATVRSGKVLEQLVAGEARKRGLVQVTKTGAT